MDKKQCALKLSNMLNPLGATKSHHATSPSYVASPNPSQQAILFSSVVCIKKEAGRDKRRREL